MALGFGGAPASILAKSFSSHGIKASAIAWCPAQLSAVDTERRGHISMRWILLHMIEEVSRHLGHADIMLESIDGTVGDYPGGTPVVAP